ncbi:hypothetical protein RJ639_022534 [Escallonia herrerae]|uniref:Uncharacterized protein n=1 Tax=Escallonia herrerae TaxID=1293975 RepID=A0AA88V8Y3_9ASTE|nr:hypothetical protein RJ639_021352 [Escallonia herrerae]KAK3002373.1 hypothetical protein RJ639_022534 [Escallonia herrerae]
MGITVLMQMKSKLEQPTDGRLSGIDVDADGNEEDGDEAKVDDGAAWVRIDCLNLECAWIRRGYGRDKHLGFWQKAPTVPGREHLVHSREKRGRRRR